MNDRSRREVLQGRDMSALQNSPEFWTVRIVMVSDYDGSLGAFRPGRNMIEIAYEVLRSAYPNSSSNVDIAIQCTLIHELGHLLMTGLNADHNSSGVMKTDIDPADLLNPDFQKFLISDIQEIQYYSRANK